MGATPRDRPWASIPGVPGQATGPVIHISDDRDPGAGAEGAVLVCGNIGPTAIRALLRKPTAILSTTGGPLSHAAIVARDGIPGVTAMPAAIRSLAEGTILHVDGLAGPPRPTPASPTGPPLQFRHTRSQHYRLGLRWTTPPLYSCGISQPSHTAECHLYQRPSSALRASDVLPKTANAGSAAGNSGCGIRSAAAAVIRAAESTSRAACNRNSSACRIFRSSRLSAQGPSHG